MSMRFETINQLRETVIHCALACPFRNEAAGYYPKPPRGPHDSKVMMVFENPGSPKDKNTRSEGHPEMTYTIRDIGLRDALHFTIQGQRNWLFKTAKLNKATWDEAGFVIGESVYTTDSHRCPDPAGQKGLDRAEQAKANKQRLANKHKARVLCSQYLKEELRLVNPNVIVAFGEYARRSIEMLEGVNWSGKTRTMPKEQRIVEKGTRLYALLPHPSSLRYMSSEVRAGVEVAIAYVFGKAKEFAEAKSEGADGSK
jgi:uracil-DNA glycosylase